MVDKIEVFVKNENVVISQGIIRPLADHGCTDRMTGKTEKIMPESDRLALNVAEEFANERGLDVVVHDVHTYKGRLNAMLKGVSKTPTIIVGTSRIEGDLTSDQLKNRLQSCLAPR
jgi:hypothetical protein